MTLVTGQRVFNLPHVPMDRDPHYRRAARVVALLDEAGLIFRATLMEYRVVKWVDPHGPNVRGWVPVARWEAGE